jgi:hypothetical protein
MANRLIFGNNVSSTIAGSIVPTSTQVNVASGTGITFPHPVAGQQFIATLIDQLTGQQKEIVHVTNVTGDTMTIVRAQEGTVALSWPAGSIFSHLHTAGAMAQMLQQGDDPNRMYVGYDTSTTVNLIEVTTTTPALASLVVDTNLEITINNTNTNAVNMQLLGSIQYPVVRSDNTALSPGDLVKNQKAMMVWTGTNFQLVNYKHTVGEVFFFDAAVPTPDYNHIVITIPYSGPLFDGLLVTGSTEVNTGPVLITVEGTAGLIASNVPAYGHEGQTFTGGELSGMVFLQYNLGDDPAVIKTGFYITGGYPLAYLETKLPAGSPGPTGPMGPQGPAGPAGPQGHIGLTGPPGPQGVQGPQGPQGPAGGGGGGTVGPPGPEGPMGPAGPQGPRGQTGLTGATGPEGPTGLRGPTGAQGPVGPRGLTGPAGPGSWTGYGGLGSVWMTTGYGQSGPPPYAGSWRQIGTVSQNAGGYFAVTNYFFQRVA